MLTLPSAKKIKKKNLLVLLSASVERFSVSPPRDFSLSSKSSLFCTGNPAQNPLASQPFLRILSFPIPNNLLPHPTSIVFTSHISYFQGSSWQGTKSLGGRSLLEQILASSHALFLCALITDKEKAVMTVTGRR